MKRYLLFDSNCSTCSKIARAIVQEVNGQFTIRSFYESDIQDLLNQANPDWPWKPTLLEISDNKVRTYTGFGMGLRLILVLGFRKAIRLMNLIAQNANGQDNVSSHSSRRHFLRQSGAMMTTIPLLVGWRKFNMSEQTARPRALSDSQGISLEQMQEIELQTEEWNGFVLLPTWDFPVPQFVQQAPVPIMGKALGSNVDQFRPDIKQFSSIEGLLQDLPHPLAYPTKFPLEMELTTAETTRFVGSGDVHNVTLQFESPDRSNLVRLTVSYMFPRPYPVHPVPSPIEHLEKIIQPEKVSFTPSPGVRLFTETSVHLFWINQDVLYSLHVELEVMESEASREQLQTIIDSLIQK